MKKRLALMTISLVLCITALLQGPAGSVYAQNEVTSIAPVLVEDLKTTDGEFKNFRTVLDDFKGTQETQQPSREGLSELRASGSSEFSRKGLREIKKRLPASRIMVVDLREESHGFVNDRPVSWKGEHNAANKGLSLEEIKKDETKRLGEVKSTDPSITALCTEETLCRETGLEYARFPVTDYSRPSDNQVDRFTTMVKTLPRDTWLHFHCKAGAGRTTTFMTMYDMMHNARTVSCDDIIRRQYLLGGIDLAAEDKNPDAWNRSLTATREAFIRKFYEYCRDQQGKFTIPWSSWLRKNQTEEHN
jgi:hypothetical protein